LICNIESPTFQDRVVHHALMAVAGPILERGALEHSYACRRGRGQHAAVQQARSWVRRTDWYGKMDVQRFYDSIDQQRLRDQLRRRFRESALLRLFDELIGSFEHQPGRGLPIGALTSQYLGNFYLDHFDHALKATGHAHRYLRYMDDSLVFGSREQLEDVRTTAHAVLGELGLTLKHGGEWNRAERGIPFLGFVLYPDRLRVNRQGRRRYRRKLRALRCGLEHARLSDHQAQERLGALVAHVATADDRAWRSMVHSFYDFDAVHAVPKGDTPEPRARDARRCLEQQPRQLPLGLSQQEFPWQQEPQPGLPRGLVPRHDDGRRKAPSTDGACSCSGRLQATDEASRKPPPGPDILAEHGSKNGSGGAALDQTGPEDA